MNYNIKWSQDYPGWENYSLVKQLEEHIEALTEAILHHDEFDFPEAREVLAKVMAK